MKKICFVGGGTGGHILPLLNLVEACVDNSFETSFILADQPLDRAIVKKNFRSKSIDTYFLKTGKIRYYFAWENFKDLFRIVGAIFRARKLLKRLNPDIIFFKGGFVCFPVLVAAKYLFPRFKGRIYLHDSDISQSRLSRLIARHATQVFTNFGPRAMPLFYSLKSKVKPAEKSDLPRLFIFGASQGAVFINTIFHKKASEICQKYRVTLISGIGKAIDFSHKNFEQHELLDAKRFAEKLSEADLVITRGSASLFQILELHKKAIVIPLPSSARNHQVKNTLYFVNKGLVYHLPQNKQAVDKLCPLIDQCFADDVLAKKLKDFCLTDSTDRILATIMEAG